MGNTQKDPNRRDRKFFFDLHDFDAPDIKSEAPPPPPTYSQEEMDAARLTAQEQGRQKGLNEAAASREQKITQLVQQISTQFATLFAAEQERESRYEDEVIALVLQTFDKLFPSLNERLGPYEARQAIARILKTAGDQSEITIRIAPDYVDDIEAVIAPIRNKEINPPNFHIIPDESLGDGDCRLQWRDGGAVRDAARLSDAIRTSLLSLAPEAAAALPPDESAQGTDAINNDINDETAPESPQSEAAPQDSGETHE